MNLMPSNIPLFIKKLIDNFFIVASLLTANGWSLDTQHAEKTAFMMTQLRLLQDIINRCNELHVDATEYACLKAITLFRPGKVNYRSFDQSSGCSYRPLVTMHFLR